MLEKKATSEDKSRIVVSEDLQKHFDKYNERQEYLYNRPVLYWVDRIKKKLNKVWDGFTNSYM